jgi:dipeptidyl aminopeptidase/acylaminoacyl peptidase
MDRHARSDSVIVHNGPGSPEALLIGGPLEEHADLVALANPANHVTPSAPPFLIMHGELDRVVPYHQSVLLYEALRQAEVPATLFTVEGAGHGFEGFEIGRIVE